MVEYATLQVREDTKAKLAALRRGGETYDALVQRLMGDALRAQEAEFLNELDAMYAKSGELEPLR